MIKTSIALTVKRLFISLLLTNACVAYGNTADAPQTITLTSVLIGIVCIGLAFAILAITFYKHSKELSRKNTELDQRYALLEQQSTEKNEKLYKINNQLYEEIAKHEDTEELLTEARNYLQNIINSMPSILIGIDRDGIVSHWNSAAHNKTNISYTDALGKNFETLIDEPSINTKLIKSAIDNKKLKKLESIQEGHGHNIRYRDITIYPLTTLEAGSAVIRIDDVTTRIQLENMIIQNEKMRSLGELSAGVAHEINNPLGTILQNIQNIQRRLSNELPANATTAEGLQTDIHTINQYLTDRKIFNFLEHIKTAGERAAAIVTNMLEFSSSNTFNHEPIELISLLNRSLDLAISSSSLSKEYDHISFNIIRHLPEECPVIYGSSGELQQVILNLINNAYQAYSDKFLNSAIANNNTTEEGILDIHVDLRVNTGDAIIQISDNGPGMSEWTQRHIFEPFFSTKEAGQGTGLGLSVSYFIITEHHRGSITVSSEIDKGTTFTIKLPLKK
jgi:signal transduction histidine kinase